MHTVVLLAHALNLAERLGYVVRQEWLDGNGGARFCAHPAVPAVPGLAGLSAITDRTFSASSVVRGCACSPALVLH